MLSFTTLGYSDKEATIIYLVGCFFYGISTLVGYVMLNFIYIYIYIYIYILYIYE